MPSLTFVLRIKQQGFHVNTHAQACNGQALEREQREECRVRPPELLHREIGDVLLARLKEYFETRQIIGYEYPRQRFRVFQFFKLEGIFTVTKQSVL